MQVLRRLPGIGPKSAERIAYHLLRVPQQEALDLAQAVEAAVRSIQVCRECFNVDETNPCRVCADPERDRGMLLVVEDPRDLAPFDGTGYRGLFHVLQGRLSSLEGIGADDLTLDALEARVAGGADVREVCVATNPDLEGEATARLLAERLSGKVLVTRLARGLPAGSNLGQVSSSILHDAVEGRRPLE